MNGIADALASAWRVAESVSHGGDRRGVKLESGAQRTWATVGRDGRRGVLLEAPPAESLAGTVSAIHSATQAMAAEIYSFFEGKREARGLLLECRFSSLMPVFTGFCEPFIGRVEAGEPVGASFIACLEAFRALLAAEAAEETSRADVGLLGELIVLQDMIGLDEAAVEYWGRPANERHDFRKGANALEVKTSLRAAAAKPTVKISALDQLEPPSAGMLHLVFVKLEKDSSGLLSLHEILHALRERLGKRHAALLDEKIAGSWDDHSGALSRFALLEKAAYRVEPGFPRLTPSSLVSGGVDPGISNVKYDLDLSVAGDFGCDVAEAYASLCGCAQKR